MASLSLLARPNYRLLWLNCLMLQVGYHLAYTAQSVLAYDIGGSSRAVGFVAFAQGSSLLISIPVVGVMADRFPKRVLIAAEALVASSALLMSVLIFSGAITIGLVAFGALMLGVGISSFWPPMQATMSGTVEPIDRSKGAALFQVAVQLTRATAPFAAAGLLSIHGIGSGGTYLVAVLVYVPVLATVAMAPSAPVRKERRPSIVHELSLGLRYVLGRAEIARAMLTYVTVLLLGVGVIVVVPAFARDELGTGDSGFGIMFGCNAAGALIASLLVASHATSSRAWTILMALGIGFGLSLVFTGLAPSFLVATLGMFLAGLFGGGFQTLIQARILHLTDAAYFGRVTALTGAGWSLMNLCSPAIGGLADLIGTRLTFVAIGLALSASAAVLVTWTSKQGSQIHEAAPA